MQREGGAAAAGRVLMCQGRALMQREGTGRESAGSLGQSRGARAAALSCQIGRAHV